MSATEYCDTSQPRHAQTPCIRHARTHACMAHARIDNQGQRKAFSLLSDTCFLVCTNILYLSSLDTPAFLYNTYISQFTLTFLHPLPHLLFPHSRTQSYIPSFRQKNYKVTARPNTVSHASPVMPRHVAFATRARMRACTRPAFTKPKHPNLTPPMKPL